MQESFQSMWCSILSNMADLVESVLQAAAEKEAQFKTIKVHKDIEVDIDEGNLLAIDHNPLDLKNFRSKKGSYLKDLARDNTQLLFNKIWELKTERVDQTVVALFPPPRTRVPREKPLPKGKMETKWSAYAKTKGINKKKKSRMVWDDEVKEWRPRWGYNRVADPKRDWVLEVPGNADIYEDQFEKRSVAKKEKLAKNELQRLRNIQRNMKGKLQNPGVGILPMPTPDKGQVTRALTEARRSDASIGRFTDKLRKEKDEKGMGKKRKFEPNLGDFGQEKRKALDILDKITSKNPIMDDAKAGNQQLAAEERIRASKKTPKKLKGVKAGARDGPGGGKNRGNGKKGVGGQKRTGAIGRPKGQQMRTKK